MGNRWQFMFAIGEVLTLGGDRDLPHLPTLNHEVIWRVTLGLGAVPALIILIIRHDLPETAVWLVRQGRFREAKQVATQMYGDRLDMLPDQDVDRDEAPSDRVPRRYPQGSDPLARHALWLDRLLRAGQRILDLRLLPSRAIRDGRASLRSGHRSRDHGAST